MKISCQSCAAKYTIADEKVVGKVIKIKCKKCSSTIVVNGNDPSVLSQMQQGGGAPTLGAASGGLGGGDEDQATRVAQAPSEMGPANPDEWTVSVSDDDQRTMTSAQIVLEYSRGTLSADTYVWKDGMGDWLPLAQAPELAALLASSSQGSDAGYDAYGRAAPALAAAAYAPAEAAPAYGQPQPSYGAGGYGAPEPAAAAASSMSPYGASEPAGQAAPGYGGGPAMGSSGFQGEPPAEPQQAARRASGGRAGGSDLFGGAGLTGGAGFEPAGQAPRESAPYVPPPTPSGDKQIGERNENSVLFSLKDLVAAEASAAKSPLAPPKKLGSDTGKNARVDDILSLGGVMAAPMLAPPPLNAPIFEPPPPPVQSVPPMSAGVMAAPIYVPVPQKKSPVPFIVGGVGVAALVGAIALLVLGGDKSGAEKDGGKTTSTSDAKPAETSKPTSTSDAKATETSKPTETASTTEPSKPVDSAAPTDTSKPADPADPKASTTSTKVASGDPKKDDPKKTDPKKEDPPKEDPKPSGPSGDTPFDRGAASAALSGAAGGAKGCKKGDGPTGSAKVQVTFAPSGKATTVNVGPPFAGTPVGSCIAGNFKGLSVPPFSGAPVTVSKTVNIK